MWSGVNHVTWQDTIRYAIPQCLSIGDWLIVTDYDDYCTVWSEGAKRDITFMLYIRFDGRKKNVSYMISCHMTWYDRCRPLKISPKKETSDPHSMPFYFHEGYEWMIYTVITMTFNCFNNDALITASFTLVSYLIWSFTFRHIQTSRNSNTVLPGIWTAFFLRRGFLGPHSFYSR